MPVAVSQQSNPALHSVPLSPSPLIHRYPGKFKLGGCGFALPNSEWVHSFVDWQLATGMQFQFYSYHSYLGWTGGCTCHYFVA